MLINKFISIIKKISLRVVLYNYLVARSLIGFFLILPCRLKNFFSIYSLREKVLMGFLLIVIIISAADLSYKRYLESSKLVPIFGGVYSEGIVASSLVDIKPVIDRLTKIGLVDFDKEQKIIPSLAESWEVSDDQKTYTFRLRNFVDSQKTAEVVKSQKKDWTDIEVKTPDSHTLQFVLTQPFSPLLANLTEPLFDWGPYKIKKESKQEMIFVARDDFYLGKPFISEIVVKIYPDENNLVKALKNHEVDGLGQTTSQDDLLVSFQTFELKLPRWQILFFNLNKEVVSQKEVRQRLVKSEKLDQEINLRLVTNDNKKNLIKAQEIKSLWQELGANIEIISEDTKKLQKETIPNRDYDLLLYGLDYGVDPDPYPFWHSSQITNTGLNLSNFANVDADKLLEEARQTNNEEERKKKYDEFQKILDEEKPAIVLSQDISEYSVSGKIKGITPDHHAVTPADRFFEVGKWFIKEKRVRK